MSLTGIDHQQRYFRSLDELQQTPEFEQFLTREFPQAASEFPEGVSRRRWIQLMGASLALGGIAGCRYNREEIASFVMRPEGRVPGVPEFFATNFEWAGSVVNALVTNFDGRPIKIDGNAEHPAYANSQPKDFAENPKLAAAGTDATTQAAILSLYDPDRIPHPLFREKSGAAPQKFQGDDAAKQLAAWEQFGKFIATNRPKLDANGGEGLAIIFEPTKSPSLRRTLADVKAKYPKATLVKYESIYSGNLDKALDAVGAGNASINLNLEAAKIIVALDADLFGADANGVHYSRQFANHRSPDGAWMNRLYVVESQYSVTGSGADFRLALQSAQIPAFLKKIEDAIDAGTIVEDKVEEKTFNLLNDDEKVARVIESIASDLLTHKGESVLTVGSHHDLNVQVAVLRINQKLGNVGKTVQLVEITDELAGVATTKLDDFVSRAAEFKETWILAPNPVFTVAGDIALADALKKIPTNIYLTSSNDDETAELCQWTIPGTHPLEAWGDVRTQDGVYGIGQPMIAPLLNGKSEIEFLAILADLPEAAGEKIVMATAAKIAGGELSERTWKQALQSGFLPGSEGKAFTGEIQADIASLKGGELSTGGYELPDAPIRLAFNKDNLEVVIRPSDCVYDGRLANNGWLQELPQPITKLTWDNAALCSIGTARKLGLKQGQLAVLSVADAKVTLPVFVVPGHAEGSFTVNLGYGRDKGGVVGTNVGTNLSSFRRWNQAWVYTSVEARNTTKPYPLATTQDHFALEDEGGMRENAKRAPQLVREGTLDEYKADSHFTEKTVEHHFPAESLLWKEPRVNENHAWGMAIDLNKCIGCNACVVACQAENNIPIVGKEQVLRSREMHWLRIDRYFQCDFDRTYEDGSFKDPIDPTIVTQPMACAHCETAPCEQVCPVAATVHTEEGLNSMAYNRCIGTRYCGNNCPYKVRRFNYFNYNTEYGYFYGWSDEREKASAKLQSLVLNPEVTVRGRGVMEKCTYCVQRIQNGKIKSRTKGDGIVHDGDIVVACQQACSTQAIVFGDLNDKNSRVYKMHNDSRAYAVLEEYNIKPRTLYLSRLRNVPKRLATSIQLQPKRPGHGHGHSDDHSQESGDHGHHS